MQCVACCAPSFNILLYVQKEASEVFFAVTKLFQNADLHLRRMVYLCLKDICPDAEEVMIVTNSLMKDMNATQELYRANSIRVLRTIIDGAVLQSIERYFKQGIVDKAPVLYSSTYYSSCTPSMLAVERSVVAFVRSRFFGRHTAPEVLLQYLHRQLHA